MTGQSARIEATRDRLFNLLPAHIRSSDAENGSPLLALLEVLAAGSLEIDDEITRLYDSAFVETAPEASLPDLAALVATEALRPLPPGSGISIRAFIANTIRYRRGKGTPRVLEALAGDVTGYGAVVVEYFQRLARIQDLLDVRAERPGTANLVPGESAALAGSGFDILSRLVDLRSIARARGRHHVPNVGVHLVRLVCPPFAAPEGDTLGAAALAGVPAARPWPTTLGAARAGYFQLAPIAGAIRRLCNPDRRSQDEKPRADISDLADTLRRLPLHLEASERRRALAEGRPPRLAEAPWFDGPASLPFAIFMRPKDKTDFRRIPPEELLICNLDSDPGSGRPDATLNHQWFTSAAAAAVKHNKAMPIACGFDPRTGRLIAAKSANPGSDVAEVRVAYATGLGRAIGAGAQDRAAPDLPFDIVDTAGVRNFVRIVDAAAPAGGAATDPKRTVPTLAAALADWDANGAGMRGLVILGRCDIDTPGAPLDVKVHRGSELHLIAGIWHDAVPVPGLPFDPERLGFVIRKGRRFTVDGVLAVADSGSPAAQEARGTLTLDGLEVTGGVTIASKAASLIHLRHCTVRNPGAGAIKSLSALGGLELRIDQSVVGSVQLGGANALGRLVVRESILSADGAASAVATPRMDAELSQTTLLGSCTVKSLEASDVIFDAACTVARRQTGCVRYSYVAAGSTVPRRFRCQPDLALTAAAERKGSELTTAERDRVALGAAPVFLDRSLDEPGLALLHSACGDGIRLGGENEGEMGAFAFNAEGLRYANLASLFDDYLPFGLEAAIIDDTRSGAVAARRFRP